MGLKQELNFKKDFIIREHEALLNIYYTSNILKKRAVEFFNKYSITDVQFNVLELIYHQSDEKKGLTQVELSDMLLVNRANITTLIDRMEKLNLVIRESVPGDRRYNIIKLTPFGLDKLKKVEGNYLKEINTVMDILSNKELTELMNICEKIRKRLKR